MPICVFLKHQKGYATVLTLVLFSALGLSLFAVFNSGQIVTHKLKLQNAVDAATYSSVNVVAREMNYMAYTNRAMVANQLAIGQMVGLASWSKQMKEASANLARVVDLLTLFPPTAPIGAALQPVVQTLANIVAWGDGAVKIGVKLGVPTEDPAIRALSASQRLVHGATSAILIDVFPKVLQDNNAAKTSDDKIESSIIFPSKLFSAINSYIEPVQAPASNPFNGVAAMADYNKFEKVMRNSDDGFVFNRSYRWMREIPIWWDRTLRIEKRGGNEFEKKNMNGRYIWEWSAMDTVSLWEEEYFCWSCTNKERIPIGWGAAHASDKHTFDYSNGSIWSPVQSGKWGDSSDLPKAARLAVATYSDYKVGASSKLHSFYKFKKQGGEIVGPNFVAMASKNKDGVRTRNKIIEDATGNAVPENGSFNIEKEGSLSGDKIYAVAKAQVYFARSPDDSKGMLSGFNRGDHRQEFGNLFNPYWQVRLVEYKPQEILVAKGLLGQ